MDILMDPSATEIGNSIRKFAEARILPVAAKFDQGATLDRSVLDEIAAMGLTRLRIASENDGHQASFVECGAVAYEMGRADVGLALMVVNGVFYSEIMPLLSDSVRERWTPRVAAAAPFAVALTEPGSGSDAGALRATARREGDYYILNGEKSSTTYAGLSEFGFIFARTGGPGAAGVSLFVTPWDAEGLETQVYQSVGERVTKRGQVYLNNLKVPKDHLVGKENAGFREAMVFFDYNRALLALVCIGAAEKSLDEIIEHSKLREAFGGPLARFQGVNFPIAEHATKLEAAKLLAYKALALRDANLPHSKEASMAKWFGVREATDTLRDCVVLAGWPGYSSDLPHEKRMRDVLGMELGDGSTQILKMVIAREMIGREALPYNRK
jgi:cyclohexanecarboxyl-CoA dehydrogenase